MSDELMTTMTPSPSISTIETLPEAIKVIRKLSRTYFNSALASLFDSTDDALFEMADRSGSDNAQAMFFSAMRELRMQRKTIENDFIDAINNAFANLNKAAQSALESTREEGLSLIQDEELEETVAISNMVAKISNNYGSVLNQLTRRIDSLTTSRTITDASNPVGGEVICEAFKAACKPANLDMRAKLVIYKIFDKTVIADLEDIYFELNKKLHDLGVLPDLKSSIIKRSNNHRRKAATTDEPGSQSSQEIIEQAQEAFYALQNLLIQSKFERSPSASLFPVVEEGPSLSRNDLVEMFSAIQTENAATLNFDAPEIPKLDVYQALHNVLQASSITGPQALGKPEDDTINLISMLFEFVLDDHHLSNPMKAILARLQIPMLKVAILDKTFFSRGGHPARKLLNELATSALGWSEPRQIDNDPLYKKIKSIVETILNDFVDDVSLFEHLLEDFTAFGSKEKRRAQLIEQRTKDAEEGLAVSKQARVFIGNTLNQLVSDKNLPKVAIDLLSDGWDRYMFLVHVRQGPDSPAWAEAIKTAEDLIWSVQTKPEPSERQALLKSIPDLLQKLRNGLKTISYSSTKMREQFVSLENIHLRCLRGETITPDLDPVNAPNASTDEPQASHLDLETRDTDDLTPIKPIDEAIISSPVIFKDATAQNDADGNTDMATEAPLEVLENIDVGTWVEFKYDNKSATRAKLAAILKASGNYIFVNRLGIKIAEETPTSLARMIHEDKVEILDRAMVFDRALESVIGHLREMKAS